MSGSTSEHAEPVGSRPDRPKPDLGRFAGEVVSGRPGPDAERLSGRRVALLADGDAAVELVPSLLHTTGLLKVFLTNPVWVLPEITLPSSLGLAAPLLQLPFVESVRRLVSDRVARATSGNPDDTFTPVAEWLAVVSLWFQVRDPWTRRQLTPDRPQRRGDGPRPATAPAFAEPVQRSG